MSDTAQSPVWLEVALNGAAGKAFQPGIPITESEIIEQGVECARLGAAIIHVHAYDEAGQPSEDADIYSRIIEGIKQQVDVVVYPTLALGGSLEARFAPIQTLSERGLLEASVIDPGSVNLTHVGQLSAGQEGFVYANPEADIRHGLALAQQYGWRPAYAIYEPGFARLGAALAAQYEDCLQPIYRVMFSDGLLFGLPPSESAVAVYARLFDQLAPKAPWMISGLDADIAHLFEPALALGAQIRVGLEDAPFGSPKSNVQWVQEAVEIIARQSRPLASAQAVRDFP